MAIPSWPADVPYRSDRDAFEISARHRPVIATEVEDGPTIMRVQSRTRIATVTCAIRMTGAQLATLETFLEDTLDQATGHFTMPVPIGEDESVRRCYIDGGVWRSKQLAPDLWNASFTLCVFVSAG